MRAPTTKVLGQVLPLPGSVAHGSKPQFPHLENGDLAGRLTTGSYSESTLYTELLPQVRPDSAGGFLAQTV